MPFVSRVPPPKKKKHWQELLAGRHKTDSTFLRCNWTMKRRWSKLPSTSRWVADERSAASDSHQIFGATGYFVTVFNAHSKKIAKPRERSNRIKQSNAKIGNMFSPSHMFRDEVWHGPQWQASWLRGVGWSTGLLKQNQWKPPEFCWQIQFIIIIISSSSSSSSSNSSNIIILFGWQLPSSFVYRSSSCWTTWAFQTPKMTLTSCSKCWTGFVAGEISKRYIVLPPKCNIQYSAFLGFANENPCEVILMFLIVSYGFLFGCSKPLPRSLLYAPQNNMKFNRFLNYTAPFFAAKPSPQ